MGKLLITISIMLCLVPSYVRAEESGAYGVEIEQLLLQPHYPYLNGKIEYDLLIRNTGTQTVRNIFVHTEISNGSSFDRSVALTNSLAPGGTAYATVRHVPNPEQGVYLLTSRIDRINDVELENPPVVEGVLGAYDDGYERNVVVEAATSTSSGLSPAEKVLLGRIRKQCPHWIRIAVHRDDPMADASFDALSAEMFDKVPKVSVNRDIVTEDVPDIISRISSLHDHYLSFPSYAYIAMDARTASDDRSVQVDASVQFSYPTDFTHRLAFAVIEDNVGPYDQSNSYAGGAKGQMGGWENLGATVRTNHNDVGRYTTGFEGIEDSLPEDIQPLRVYRYSTTLPLDNVGQETYRLVGMIINTWSGEIVNAKQLTVAKSGIESVADDDNGIVIRVSDGTIRVEGADSFDVYDSAGCRVSPDGLAPGVYIVRAGAETRKVAVR